MKKRKKRKPVKAVTEDWHKPEYEEDPDSAPAIFTKPPKRYEKNFLQKLDGRTKAFQVLNASYQSIMADMGGADALSHVQLTLVERFVFLEFILKHIETRIARSPRKSEELLGKWIQGLNSLSGLAKVIGLERRAKKIESLQSYVKKSRRNKNGR